MYRAEDATVAWSRVGWVLVTQHPTFSLGDEHPGYGPFHGDVCFDLYISANETASGRPGTVPWRLR